MRRSRSLALTLCLVLAACGVGGEASFDPIETANVVGSPTTEASAEPTPTPTPDATESAAPTAELSEEPQPTPVLPPASVEPVALPDGLDQFAWATVVGVSYDELGNATAHHLFAGRLGSAYSHDEVVPITNQLDLEVLVDQEVVALVTEGREETVVELRRIDGWAHITTIELDTWVVWQDIELDARRGMVYVSVPNVGRGLDIVRFGFDGSATRLLSFDERFIPDSLAPKNVATLAVDDDGTLLVEACDTSDGCRLWTIPSSAPIADPALRLPADTPGVCRAVGATESWLVVSDNIVCGMDYMPAPLPFRAISRIDGTSHLISNEPLTIQRVLVAGDRATAVGTRSSGDLSTNGVVAIDVVSGDKRTIISGLPGFLGGSWLWVDRQVLTRSWVMVSPSGPSYDAPLRTILLNVESGEQIELPVGTFGYGT